MDLGWESSSIHDEGRNEKDVRNTIPLPSFRSLNLQHVCQTVRELSIHTPSNFVLVLTEILLLLYFTLGKDNTSSGGSYHIIMAAPALEYVLGDIIAQCAESKVYHCDFYGSPAVCKHRFVKEYRHPKLDQKLREQRTVREARALVRCTRHGIRVPLVYAVNKITCQIVMERVMGETVKEALDRECVQIRQVQQQNQQRNRSSSIGNLSIKRSAAASSNAIASPVTARLLRGIGQLVGLLHNVDIIHGDLTTSNVMLLSGSESGAHHHKENDSQSRACDGMVLIDFGLVADKSSAEERAVDLYVLERAIVSTHPFVEAYAAQIILEGYRSTVEEKKDKSTLARLEVVRARGRKRSMIG